MMRSLTFLNELGDLTVEWSEDQDAAMEALIAKKMKEGVTFYILKKNKDGSPAKTKPTKLKDAAKAREHRALSIPDADLSKFVLEGKGTARCMVHEKIETTKRAESAKEAASADSVAVKPRKGG